MADENAVELLKRSSARFGKRQTLDTFRQEVALNFAPDLASWTNTLIWGDDFASHLADGTPLLMARDFVGQVGAMLRPAGKQWFWHRTQDDEINNNRGCREYLDWKSTVMMRIMTDRSTGFSTATKTADRFFSLFGDAVLSVDYDGPSRSALRIAAWHTKDCVWAIGNDNKPDTITRREQIPLRNMVRRFRQPNDKISAKVKEKVEKAPDEEIEIRHEVLPAEEYDAYIKKGALKRKDGWVSVWVDATNQEIIRETHQETFRYVVPMWVRVLNWPYAISPATTIALPDARLIQQQAIAIMEAAEKQINPPLIAVQDVIRGTVGLDSRAITWVDKQYDERTGDSLRPLELGKNFGLGIDSLDRTAAQLARAFYLDVLRMPDTRNSKSTLEVQFLIDEYVRAALPLFAPIQADYNEAMLYEVDKAIEAAQGYGNVDVPEELKDVELTYQWDNPLTDMMERQKAQMVAEVAQLANTIAALEAAASQSPSLQQIDSVKMFRESVMGIGGAPWLLDESAAKKQGEMAAQMNGVQQMIGAAPNVAKLIDSGVNAAEAAATIPNPAEPGYPMLPAPA